ncbi:MAG: PEP-CTERM sorting domain-containing protein [Deltaproteobacteria bacterium]|jgi:hypothetical protein|nr:PEP-CTERM sorting domain-containing protein [Deltaproteobacteria bacterium]
MIALVGVGIGLAPAVGLAARFQEAGANGFQVGFVSDAEIEALDDFVIDDVSVPNFITAGVDPGSAVVLSQSVCILPTGGNVCETSAGGASTVGAIVTWEITSIDTAEIETPFTLMFTGLVSPLEQPTPETGYLSSEVDIGVNVAAPPGLDTSRTPGVELDPSSPTGFDPFVLVRDETFGTGSAADLYLGWTVVAGVGDKITFFFEVDPLREDMEKVPYAPQFRIAAIPVVVPEPGTALLMGLGLASLTWSRRRGH